jgi:hypothetical protein
MAIWHIYIMSIWYILFSFVYFFPIFGMLYREKSGSPAAVRIWSEIGFIQKASFFLCGLHTCARYVTLIFAFSIEK